MEGEFSLPNVDTEWSFSLSHSETKLNVFVISLMPGVLHTGSDCIKDMINAPSRKKTCAYAQRGSRLLLPSICRSEDGQRKL